jgi:2-polyprenyl-6-methoxyphenol hydroxylase-like FAD-dependent oxidoreductase
MSVKRAVEIGEVAEPHIKRNMAMEDACVLAEELRLAANVANALASYVSRRKARVEWVQHQSMAIGESLTMASAVRNATLRQRGNEAMHARFGPLVSAP